MNPPTSGRTRLLCLLFAACLCFIALLPVRAENWQTATIDVTAARMNHSFALGANSTGDPHFLFEESAGGYAATRLSAWLDLDQPVTLFDWSAGDTLTLGFANGAGIDARHALWDAGGGPARQYFMLPASVFSHEFALVHPDGTTYPVTKGASIAVTTTSGAAFEASALCTPGQEFWLVDLNAYARSPSWETWLVATPWTDDPSLRPLVTVALYLEGREDGHVFTIHSAAAGGPVILQSVQARGGPDAAWPALGGGWINGAAGSSFEVYGWSAALSFAVGRGMDFWITRDADVVPIESARLTADDSSGSPLAWPLYGVFPAVVPGSVEAQVFRVNIQR